MTSLTSELNLEDYRGKHILVTGSSGYLANNLIHTLKNIECQITRVARSGKILTLVEGKCKVRDIIGDLTTPTLWQQVLPGVDIVFHFAGQANIVQANQTPVTDIQHSIIPLLQLLCSARDMQIKPHVVLASSVSIYGYRDAGLITEEDNNQPHTIYDLHKLSCESYLQYFIQHGFVSGCSLRLSNVYGPGIQSNQHYQGLINHAIYCGLQREPLPIYDGGLSERDYLYLNDATRAFLAAGLLPNKVNGQTFIISSGISYTVASIIDKVIHGLQQVRNITATSQNLQTPQPKTQHFRSHSAKFYAATGWQATTSIEEGIASTIAAQ